MSFEELKKKLIQFRNDRNWKQFHDPKNLAEAISIEASELLENFLWKSVDESKELSDKKINNIKEEISDILNFCIYLSEALDFDILEEAEKKLRKNGEKYPIDKVWGNAKKYNEYE